MEEYILLYTTPCLFIQDGTMQLFIERMMVINLAKHSSFWQCEVRLLLYKLFRALSKNKVIVKISVVFLRSSLRNLLTSLFLLSNSTISILSIPWKVLFYLYLTEVYLKLLVPDTVRIMRTTSTILKVEKSELGFLSWTHDGKDVYGKEPGLNFLNPSKTQLQISNARAEHGGKYEVALREGECKLQKEINLDIIGLWVSTLSWDRVI